jgi:23S rRNA pseudouridine955/2504/2580 synthase
MDTLKPAKYLKLIDKDHDGQRVDNYLITYYKGVPKSRLYRAIRKGEVRVNKKRIKQTDRLLSGDLIRLPPLKTSQDKKTLSKMRGVDLKWLEKSILFEDDDLMVLNKPPGLAVHGGTGVGLSLLDFLMQVRPNQYLRLVHRLDQATSGCILIAKSRQALLELQLQFKEHRVEKNYLALVSGKLKKSEMTLITKLKKERDGKTGVRMISAPEGKEAVSHFSVEKQQGNTALLSIAIETGRMHQIRFQVAEIGHPIVGDPKYGNPKVNAAAKEAGFAGLHLHCSKMVFDYKDKRLALVALSPRWVAESALIDAKITF